MEFLSFSFYVLCSGICSHYEYIPDRVSSMAAWPLLALALAVSSSCGNTASVSSGEFYTTRERQRLSLVRAEVSRRWFSCCGLLAGDETMPRVATDQTMHVCTETDKHTQRYEHRDPYVDLHVVQAMQEAVSVATEERLWNLKTPSPKLNFAKPSALSPKCQISYSPTDY